MAPIFLATKKNTPIWPPQDTFDEILALKGTPYVNKTNTTRCQWHKVLKYSGCPRRLEHICNVLPKNNTTRFASLDQWGGVSSKILPWWDRWLEWNGIFHENRCSKWQLKLYKTLLQRNNWLNLNNANYEKPYTFSFFHEIQPNFEPMARLTIILRFSRWQCSQGSCNAKKVDIHQEDCSSSYLCRNICNKTFIQKLPFCWKCSEIFPFLFIYLAFTEVFCKFFVQTC